MLAVMILMTVMEVAVLGMISVRLFNASDFQQISVLCWELSDTSTHDKKKKKKKKRFEVKF